MRSTCAAACGILVGALLPRGFRPLRRKFIKRFGHLRIGRPRMASSEVMQLKASPRGANFQIVGGFADLDGDTRRTHRSSGSSDRAVYANASAVLWIRARALSSDGANAVAPQRIAYLLWGIRNSPGGKQILVRTATPAKCEAGGDAKGRARRRQHMHSTGDRLQLVQR